jgi:hypothetical protein
VLLGQNLAVVHWLDSAVVVVLVNLLVDSGVDLFMQMRLDNLVCDGWGHSLVDGGVVVASAGSEILDGCLNLVHFDDLWWLVEVFGEGSEEVLL